MSESDVIELRANLEHKTSEELIDQLRRGQLALEAEALTVEILRGRQVNVPPIYRPSE